MAEDALPLLMEEGQQTVRARSVSHPQQQQRACKRKGAGTSTLAVTVRNSSCSVLCNKRVAQPPGSCQGR